MLKAALGSFGFLYSVNWIEDFEGSENLFKVYDVILKFKPTTQNMFKLTLFKVPSLRNRLMFFPSKSLNYE